MLAIYIGAKIPLTRDGFAINRKRRREVEKHTLSY